MPNDSASELTVVAHNLPQNKTQELLNNYADSFSKAKMVVAKAKDIKVTSEDQVDQMKEARKIRLELKDIRVGVENKRKELKEQSLREGKAIDGMANIIKALIVPTEEYLEKQEKFAEEQKKFRDEQELQRRITELSPYVEDISVYDLQVDSMSNETFTNLVKDRKAAFEALKAAEKRAEEERIEEEKKKAAENERIRKENEKLRAANQLKQEKLEKERRAKRAAEDKLRREQEQKAAQQRAEEEAARKEKLAPDKEKLLTLADRMDLVKLPEVSSLEAKAVIREVQRKVNELATYVREEANSL